MKMKTLLLLIFILPLFFAQCKRPHVKYDQTKEARGIWVTRWEWAKPEFQNNPEAQQERIMDILDLAKQAKLNFVLFQVRGNGDAFYRSEFEPWSNLLTGELGKDPGWDPLQFAVEQAHQRGLELHTWVNTFPAWRGTEPPPHTTPEHVYYAHPEWIICDKNGDPMSLSGHYVNLSPGIPEVRRYVHDVCMDIIKKYDIDGMHFDYIRYPEGSPDLGYSHDSISVRLFNSKQGNPQNLSWEDWQRENINQFVRQFYNDATGLKPWVKISAAVIGKYDYSKWNGYHVVYQDALQWIKEGKIDFICPMIYWQISHPTAPFDIITHQWLKNYLHSRYIFPGMMINKLGSDNWPPEEVVKQVMAVREAEGNGMVFFSFSGLEKANDLLKNRGFQFLANFPSMPWKDGKPPMDPQNLQAEVSGSRTVMLSWQAPDSALQTSPVHRYNIFRSEKTPVDVFAGKNLIHIARAKETAFIDAVPDPDKTYFYVVTALDRVNNESPPSNEVRVIFPKIAKMNSNKNTIVAQ